MSINLTPFSKIRLKISCYFVYGGGWVGSRGSLSFYKANKTFISTTAEQVSGDETNWYFDVSGISEHAFFVTNIVSAGEVSNPSVYNQEFYIREIEFIK